MVWNAYVQTVYCSDLKVFAEVTGARTHRVQFCECEFDRVQRFFASTRFPDPERLVILAFWDALLLAAVHCYDPLNYGAYIATVPQAPYVKSHSGTGTHLPHLLLALTPWNDRTSGHLQESGNLLPVWAGIYDSAIAGITGAGTRILQALIDDRSLTINPYNKLDPRVLQVIGKTLRQAVASA